MTGAAASLNGYYQELNARYAPEYSPDYEGLVVAGSNAEEPIHGWFRMKEAFSAALLPRLIKDLNLNGADLSRVLDPFAGSGTTLVSALQWGAEDPERKVHVEGIEVNPFLHLLSSSKVDVLTMVDAERFDVARLFEAAAVGALEYRGPGASLPELSTFRNTDYFPTEQLSELLRIRMGIEVQDLGDLVRRLLQIALAGVAESSSRLRRDGRALRYVPEKLPGSVAKSFARMIRRMADDIRRAATGGEGRVTLGDARSTAGVPSTFDFCLFSPPYPNNIDYTEVYKTEAWLLGLIDSPESFRNQRLATMRSHPSVRWTTTTLLTDDELVRSLRDVVTPVVAAVPQDRYERARTAVITGYVEDAARVFRRLHSTMAPRGYVTYVVGNSHHGSGANSVTIAADLLLARTAEMCGFTVEKFIEARRLRRRASSPLMRESVVVLRRET